MKLQSVLAAKWVLSVLSAAHPFDNVVAARDDSATAESCTAVEHSLDVPHDESGASRAAKVFTLPQALAYAREHQPSFRAAAARLSQSEQAARIPRRQWLPLVGVNAQAFVATTNNTSATTAISPLVTLPRIGGTTVTGTTRWRAAASTLAAIGVTQEVFDFGRIAAEAADADAMVDVASQSLDAARFDLQFNVEEAYFAVLTAKSILAASEDAYKRARAHRDVARASVDVGLRSPVELARTSALLAQFDVGRIRSRGGVENALVVLATAVGLPDTSIDITQSPPRLVDMPTLDKAIQLAMERNPAIREALARLRAQQERSRAIGATMRPNLLFTGTISGRAGDASEPHLEGDGWLPAIGNWDVGLMLNWPLFDGTIWARRAAAESEERVLKEGVDVARQKQLSNLRQGHINFEIARAALPALEEAVIAAKDNYDQANAQFEAGLRDSVELADAENIRVNAEIQRALGQFAVARARAAFGRLIAEEAFP